MEESRLNYSPLEPKVSHNSNCAWLFTSFLSFLFFGVGSFLAGAYPSNPYLVIFEASCGFATLGLSLTLYFWIKKCLLLKKIAFLSDSTLFLNGKLAPGVISSAFVGICNNLGHFFLFIGFSNDENNKGVISILAVGSSVVSGILFYFVYKEKLTKIQIAGMAVCFSGFVIIAFESKAKGNLLAFYSGVAALFAFSLRNLCLRMSHVAGLDIITTGIVSALWEPISAVIFLTILSFWIEIFTSFDYWWMAYSGGFLISCGTFSITHSVMHGKVGPASMIANMLGILQMYLDYAFYSKVPDMFKIIGSCICLLGVGLLMVGQQLMEFFTKREHKYKSDFN